MLILFFFLGFVPNVEAISYDFPLKSRIFKYYNGLTKKEKRYFIAKNIIITGIIICIGVNFAFNSSRKKQPKINSNLKMNLTNEPIKQAIELEEIFNLEETVRNEIEQDRVFYEMKIARSEIEKLELGVKQNLEKDFKNQLNFIFMKEQQNKERISVMQEQFANAISTKQFLLKSEEMFIVQKIARSEIELEEMFCRKQMMFNFEEAVRNEIEQDRMFYEMEIARSEIKLEEIFNLEETVRNEVEQKQMICRKQMMFNLEETVRRAIRLRESFCIKEIRNNIGNQIKVRNELERRQIQQELTFALKKDGLILDEKLFRSSAEANFLAEINLIKEASLMQLKQTLTRDLIEGSQIKDVAKIFDIMKFKKTSAASKRIISVKVFQTKSLEVKSSETRKISKSQSLEVYQTKSSEPEVKSAEPKKTFKVNKSKSRESSQARKASNSQSCEVSDIGSPESKSPEPKMPEANKTSNVSSKVNKSKSRESSQARKASKSQSCEVYDIGSPEPKTPESDMKVKPKNQAQNRQKNLRVLYHQRKSYSKRREFSRDAVGAENPIEVVLQPIEVVEADPLFYYQADSNNSCLSFATVPTPEKKALSDSFLPSITFPLKRSESACSPIYNSPSGRHAYLKFASSGSSLVRFSPEVVHARCSFKRYPKAEERHSVFKFASGGSSLEERSPNYHSPIYCDSVARQSSLRKPLGSPSVKPEEVSSYSLEDAPKAISDEIISNSSDLSCTSTVASPEKEALSDSFLPSPKRRNHALRTTHFKDKLCAELFPDDTLKHVPQVTSKKIIPKSKGYLKSTKSCALKCVDKKASLKIVVDVAAPKVLSKKKTSQTDHVSGEPGYLRSPQSQFSKLKQKPTKPIFKR